MAHRASWETPAYLSPANRGLPSFQMLTWVCMPVPLSPIQRFGHEGHGVAGLVGHVLEHIFEPHELVGHLQQGFEAHVDFGLAGRWPPRDAGTPRRCPDFPMPASCRNADPGICPVGGTGNSLPCGAACIPGWVPRSGLCSRYLPQSRWHKSTVALAVVADVVEDEKFGFRTDEGRVADAGALEIGFRLFWRCYVDHGCRLRG
jgi:hypothetical protein